MPIWRGGDVLPGGVDSRLSDLSIGFSARARGRAGAIVRRCQGYISKVLAYHALGEGDTLLLVDPDGVSPVAIEAALKAKEMGAKVVAITARECARLSP